MLDFAIAYAFLLFTCNLLTAFSMTTCVILVAMTAPQYFDETPLTDKSFDIWRQLGSLTKA